VEIRVERTSPNVQGSGCISALLRENLPALPDGPRCEHGHAGVPRTELYDADACAQWERPGFVYLIGHARAVKMGGPRSTLRATASRNSNRRPIKSLELLGLLEGTLSTERDLHRRFSGHWLRGERFKRHEDILAYFTEHGIDI
jgi:hypothetical protein